MMPATTPVMAPAAAPTAALAGPPIAPSNAPATVSETTAPAMVPTAKLAEPVMAFCAGVSDVTTSYPRCATPMAVAVFESVEPMPRICATVSSLADARRVTEASVMAAGTCFAVLGLIISDAASVSTSDAYEFVATSHDVATASGRSCQGSRTYSNVPSPTLRAKINKAHSS